MSRIVWLFLSAVLFTSTTLAKPLSPEQVPEPLKPWIAWVLQDKPEPACPFIYNSYEEKRCSWPTQTQLDLTNEKGVFSMSWTVYQDSWVSLPGDKTHWPLNVTVDNKTALVMDKDGTPSVKLAAGSLHQLKGEFLWLFPISWGSYYM